MAGLRLRPNLNGAYAPLVSSALAANVPTPLYTAHKAGANVWPENTREACRGALGAGAQAINVDTWPLTDGGLGVCHNQTVDFATTGSGNITDLNTSAVQQLVIDAGSWFAGGGWGNLAMPLFEQIAAEFGNRVLLELEAKPFTGSGAVLVAAIQKFGLSQSVRVSSFSTTELAAPIAAGLPCWYLTTGSNYATTDYAAMKAMGCVGVGFDMTVTPTSYVATAHAAGLKVHVYTALRRVDWWKWYAVGADSVAVDDPIYIRPDYKPLTTDPFKAGAFHHGMIASAGAAAFPRGSFIGSIGSARYSVQSASGSLFTFQGWGAPIAGTVETTLKQAVGSGATSIIVDAQNKPLAGKALVIDPTGTSETVTPTADGVLNADGTYTVAVPALANAHSSGVRVYSNVGWTITLNLTYDAMGSSSTRWPAVVVGSPDDKAYTDGSVANNDNGYLFLLRASGSLETSARASTTLLTGTPANVATTAISAPLVLSAGLTANAAITALPVNAIATAIVAGQQFMLPNGQIATASGSAIIGATSVPIASLTPTAAVALGVSIPQTVQLRIQRTATQIKATRVDTNNTITWTDTTWFGGYFHFGGNFQSSGMAVSVNNVSITTP